jgi:hypothetical protein
MRHLGKVLGLPAGIVPIAVLAIGWPVDVPAARCRYDEAKVRQGKWS